MKILFNKLSWLTKKNQDLFAAWHSASQMHWYAFFFIEKLLVLACYTKLLTDCSSQRLQRPFFFPLQAQSGKRMASAGMGVHIAPRSSRSPVIWCATSASTPMRSLSSANSASEPSPSRAPSRRTWKRTRVSRRLSVNPASSASPLLVAWKYTCVCIQVRCTSTWEHRGTLEVKWHIWVKSFLFVLSCYGRKISCQCGSCRICLD